MGLSRRSRRDDAPIWPGFVDAMTSLLLVLMFVLTIFLIVQFVLRETITNQDNQLSSLNEQLSGLADQLGLAQSDNKKLKAQVGSLGGQLSDAVAKSKAQDATIAALNAQLTQQQGQLTQAQAKITSFEQQVASLLADQKAAQGQIGTLTGQVKDLTDARDKLKTEQEALQLAVAKARTEIDAKTEEARLAAARRDALQALVDDLNAKNADKDKALSAAQDQLSQQDKQRLVDAAAAEALRQKLKDSQAELTAMTLALDQQRQKAEDTLTMLAAAQSAQKDLSVKLAAALAARDEASAHAVDAQQLLKQMEAAQGQSQSQIQQKLAAALAAKAAAEDQAKTQLTEAQKQAVLLATASQQLSQEQAKSAESARQIALLNQQVASLRSQLQGLQNILDAAADKDKQAKVQIQSLGSQLNAALAQVASEQRKRADLEEAERKRLESQNKQLENYRSEFFGKVRQVIAGLPGVRVVGDRFVFSSEVLFEPGSATLSQGGKTQIGNVTKILEQVAAQIPPDINWILQVNGYTDKTPLSGSGQFKDNWELSQARALSVVHYMIDSLGFPPNRLAASGYGEYHPVVDGTTPEARAQNRRIELKLTEN